MRLIDLRVRNYRSIETEQHLPIPGQMTLVGPNNSGKTNLLRAVQVLFTGTSNACGYIRDHDLTFSAGRARTSITATFDGDPVSEASFYSGLDELHALQKTTRSDSRVSLTLYFTETNSAVYSLFPNIKRPKPATQATQYSRTHISLVNSLLNSFSLHYVPSAKSVEQIYRELLVPFLQRKVSAVIAPHVGAIEQSLSEAASALNDQLSAANLCNFTASFSLPSNSMDKLVSGFDFIIADPHKTPIQEKGMGIQTTALLAAFSWITEQERLEGKETLWLLEEPESYLHPNLAGNCNSLLDSLAKRATILKTTHSMAFVPQDPALVRGTFLNEKNRTEIVAYDSYSEAVSAIRTSLGIKFGHFYNLSQLNVFVEGKSDRALLQWFLQQVSPADHPWGMLRQAKVEDFGGVKNLSGFLKSAYQFIRKEAACVALLDGDDAGDNQRRELQTYFGQQKIPFVANQHYVSVRKGFAIEGLFPDEWIQALYEEKPNWFDSYSVDASGTLEPFQIKSGKKADVQKLLVKRAEAENNVDWAARFTAVCDSLDAALTRLHKKLGTA